MRKNLTGKKRAARPRRERKKVLKPACGRESRELAPDAAEICALLAGYTDGLDEARITALLSSKTARSLPVRKTLKRLVAEGGIREKGGRFFPVAVAGGGLKAVLALNAKGFGFAAVEGEEGGVGKDIFIAPPHLNGASQGDSVLVEIIGASRRGRREGRVLRILQRAVLQLCGVFSGNGGGGTITPDDIRLPYTLRVFPGDTGGAAEGMAVLAEIVDYGSPRRGPRARILEILGDPLDVAVQMRMAVISGGLREAFPAEVMEEAAALRAVCACEEGRLDLRHLPHVTIDGEDARDFDDAICVERHARGFTLYVSIADVSHYVRPGSAIDREAWLRGTSVYLPDRVLPMLPERLSNDLCSLVEGLARPAFTAILSFDRQGRPLERRYGRSLISSKRRLTYTQVDRLLFHRDSRAAGEMESLGDLLPMLEGAAALAGLLRKERLDRGGLDLDIPEARVWLEGEKVADIRVAPRNQAQMLIEDCMLAANEAVAETLSGAHRPVLYRIHEEPDPGKLAGFKETAQALGLALPRFEAGPEWFAAVLESARQSGLEPVVGSLLLRTLQQARYSPENTRHFGLAAPFYLHFTSPIRRYPDLLAHRALQGLLTGEASGMGLLPEAYGDLTEAGLQLSRCERRAIEAERDAQSRCAALFLKDRTGEIFDAVISGVTASGLFLLLDGSLISGFTPVSAMGNEAWLHDGRRHRLIGERSNTLYQLGGRVSARLERVDLASRRLAFSLVPEEERGAAEAGMA